MSVDLLRAGASGAILVGAIYVMTGGAPNMEALMKVGAIQAGAVVASDTLHSMLNMPISPLTDAGVVGGFYTGAQWYMGDKANWMKNFGVSAGSQFVATYATDMVRAQDPKAN